MTDKEIDALVNNCFYNEVQCSPLPRQFAGQQFSNLPAQEVVKHVLYESARVNAAALSKVLKELKLK